MDLHAWNRGLMAFPHNVRAEIDSARSSGKLDGETVARILERLGTEVETLMIQLLPAAAAFAIVPISNYQVGAVAQGMQTADTNSSSLYLGANVEFENESLNLGVHAEQSATTNAWFHGEKGLQSLAVSAAPCGYCRQFLHELVIEKLGILLPTGTGSQYTRKLLNSYLPDAFGPQNLSVKGGLMDPANCTHDLKLSIHSTDPLISAALEAAKLSYAPYTKNLAGCAIETDQGRFFSGRYAENAAYNPSMSPLQSAITFMNMNLDVASRTIRRAALVEVPTKASQKDASQDVLSSFAPGVSLEYAEAVTA